MEREGLGSVIRNSERVRLSCTYDFLAAFFCLLRGSAERLYYCNNLSTLINSYNKVGTRRYLVSFIGPLL